jgi:hypothetical protein
MGVKKSTGKMVKALAEFKFRRLGKHFLLNQDSIMEGTVYFVGGTGLPAT